MELLFIFFEVLVGKKVYFIDSYFDMGVNFLQLLQIVECIEQKFGCEFVVFDFFMYFFIIDLVVYLFEGCVEIKFDVIVELNYVFLKDIVIIGMLFNVLGVLIKSDFWNFFEKGEYSI